MYEDLEFTEDISVEDWNFVVKHMLRKYFINDIIFEKNKEILRAEIINYFRFVKKSEYLELFNCTYLLFADCIKVDKEKTISIIAESFNDVSNTDFIWMTNVLIQPDLEHFSERDKISYYFGVMDNILEGVYKPRLKLLHKIANYKFGTKNLDNSSLDFGRLVSSFPLKLGSNYDLFLKDPIYSVPVNQWRNISAHKSYTIGKDEIVLSYGKSNSKQLSISYTNFYSIFSWCQNIYRVIRLSQVLIDLNYIEEIVKELGNLRETNIRYESSLFRIIHNMQIVGFQFAGIEELEDVFCLKVRGKKNHDLKSSLIHASQCLDQISCAIYDDIFVKDKFTKAQIAILDSENNKLGSATISIKVALKKINSEIELREYLNNMVFNI